MREPERITILVSNDTTTTHNTREFYVGHADNRPCVILDMRSEDNSEGATYFGSDLTPDEADRIADLLKERAQYIRAREAILPKTHILFPTSVRRYEVLCGAGRPPNDVPVVDFINTNYLRANGRLCPKCEAHFQTFYEAARDADPYH